MTNAARSGWIPMALVANGARKVRSELGASVCWRDRSATLTVPVLASNGDARAFQIAALDFGASGFFEELGSVRPSSPHVVLLFADDEAADVRAQNLGYVLAEAAPLMTVGLAHRAIPDVRVTVESAGTDDRDALVELDARAAVYRLDDSTFCTFVARVDGRIVGKTQLISGMPGVGYLADMVVDPAHRRKGIGRALVAAAEGHARADGCDCMLLVGTEMGSHLYSSVGYQISGWLHSYVQPERR